MQDIADALGLTKVSVSKAINGQEGIGPETRERILKKATELGYESKKTAASSNVGRRFAVIVPKRFFLETDSFYTEIFYYLNKFCLKEGMQIFSIVLNVNEEKNLIFPEILQTSSFDGVFLLGELHADYLAMLAAHPLRIVAVDFYSNLLETDFVLTDNFFLGFRATQYLIQHGHKRIGFVGDYFQTNSIMDRFFGYRKALLCAQISPREEWHLINNDENNLYCMEIALPKELPTAFVCHCDMSAYYLMDTLRRNGLQVPENVSIVSFDNTKLSQNTSPLLTSYDINRKNIAETAFQCMMNRCLNASRGTNRHFVGNDLVIRDSVRSL